MGRVTHLETAENDGGPDEPEEIARSLVTSIDRATGGDRQSSSARFARVIAVDGRFAMAGDEAGFAANIDPINRAPRKV
jgi:hypothetical protein